MEKRGSIIGGIILILLGVFFLLLQFSPGLAAQFNLSQQWPLIIVGAGILFLLGAILGNPEVSVPGVVVLGTGCILYYQNSTGDWGSWAYVWSLYPAFTGLGLILLHTLRGNWRRGLVEGGGLLVVGLILFTIFAGFFNRFGDMSRLWPILIILGGLWLVWKNRPSRTHVDKEKKLD
ncbi:MAG: hypothetical protein CSB13_00185 [Chloroflexi bacterium]|nr:MAG: hypothetical protein CSB13_00185 [Chloroflexota bacterium]